MANLVQNYPGPYEIRHFYGRTGMTHEQRLNIYLNSDPGPGVPFDSCTVELNGGGTTDLESAINTYIDTKWDPLFGSAMTSLYCELWKYTPGSFESQFYSALDTGVVGTGAGTYSAATQHTISMITIEGGKMFWVALEASVDSTPGTFLPHGLGAAWDAMADYLISDSSIFLGRDTTRPFAARRILVGQNEALFKKIYRT